MYYVGKLWGQTKSIQRESFNNYSKRIDTLIVLYAKVVLIIY